MLSFFRSPASTASLIGWAGTWAVIVTVLRLSLEASNWLTLFYVYGRQKVIHDHLFWVRTKPHLVVSNGDVLRELGFLHYLIGVSLWIPTTLILIFLITKYLGADWWNEVERNLAMAGKIGWWMRAVVAISLAFSITALLPFVPALTLGAVAIAIGIFAVRWLQTNATGLGGVEGKA